MLTVRLTQHTDYALRVLMHLSVVPTHRATVVDVARAYGISLDHLRKVVQRLVAGGLVVTHRGRHGGVELDKLPNTITVGSVVRLMETDLALVECLGSSSNCRLLPACKLSAVVREAREAFLAVLDDVVISDCIHQPDLARILLSIRDPGESKGG